MAEFAQLGTVRAKVMGYGLTLSDVKRVRAKKPGQYLPHDGTESSLANRSGREKGSHRGIKPHQNRYPTYPTGCPTQKPLFYSHFGYLGYLGYLK
jgi:hypothetical protein